MKLVPEVLWFCHSGPSPRLAIWLLEGFRLPGWVTEVSRTADLSNIKGQKNKIVVEGDCSHFGMFSIALSTSSSLMILSKYPVGYRFRGRCRGI